MNAQEKQELTRIGYQDVALDALAAFKNDLSLLFCRVYCTSGPEADAVVIRSKEVGRR